MKGENDKNFYNEISALKTWYEKESENIRGKRWS